MGSLKRERVYFFKNEIILQLQDGSRKSFNYEKIIDVSFEIKEGIYNIEIKQKKYDINFPEDCKNHEGFIWELMNVYKHIQLCIRDDKHIDIVNFEDIQKNWIDNKKEVLNYFEGDYISNYIELAEDIIKDKEKLLYELFLDKTFGLILPRFLIKSTNHSSSSIERIIEYPGGGMDVIIPDVQDEKNDDSEELTLTMRKNNDDSSPRWEDYLSEIVLCTKTKTIKTHTVSYKVNERDNVYIYNYLLKPLNDGIA